MIERLATSEKSEKISGFSMKNALKKKVALITTSRRLLRELETQNPFFDCLVKRNILIKRT